MSYDKESLVLNHLSLAEDIALREWRTATHALKKDDMLSLAYLGLVDAADRWIPYCEKKEFDPAAVQFFKVFASFRIRGSIRDYIRKEDFATRTLRSKGKKLKEAGQDEGLSAQELSEKTGMSVTEINKVTSRLAARPVSLDARIGLKDYMPNAGNDEIQLKEDIDTEGIAFANEMNAVFVKTFSLLDRESKIILALHYYSKLDLKKIAEELNMAESKVSQIHARSIFAIKDAITNAALEESYAR